MHLKINLKEVAMILSYSYIFYSLYKLYSTKIEAAKTWPQGWAVSALGLIAAFFINALNIKFEKQGVLPISDMMFFKSLPFIDSMVWMAIFILLAHFLFFFWGGRWKQYVVRYDSISNHMKNIGYIISASTLLASFIFYLIQIQ